MSGFFESMQWNACVHRLDLGLYSHLKEFWGNGVRTNVNSKGKVPCTGKNLRRGENLRDLTWNAEEEEGEAQSSARNQHLSGRVVGRPPQEREIWALLPSSPPPPPPPVDLYQYLQDMLSSGHPARHLLLWCQC